MARLDQDGAVRHRDQTRRRAPGAETRTQPKVLMNIVWPASMGRTARQSIIGTTTTTGEGGAREQSGTLTDNRDDGDANGDADGDANGETDDDANGEDDGDTNGESKGEADGAEEIWTDTVWDVVRHDQRVDAEVQDAAATATNNVQAQADVTQVQDEQGRPGRGRGRRSLDAQPSPQRPAGRQQPVRVTRNPNPSYVEPPEEPSSGQSEANWGGTRQW
ncbi:hypothetical protein FOCC_FOCC013707 [Frankliniella occidentalis]|nr:hypothetical protein FOCC_FOCC013707 [Frankliniella occidentalis]